MPALHEQPSLCSKVVRICGSLGRKTLETAVGKQKSEILSDFSGFQKKLTFVPSHWEKGGQKRGMGRAVSVRISDLPIYLRPSLPGASWQAGLVFKHQSRDWGMKLFCRQCLSM